jgi:phage tail-like protein
VTDVSEAAPLPEVPATRAGNGHGAAHGRGLMPGAEVPISLGEMLPGVYQEDLFTMEWCKGLDENLAPVFATLDCLPFYIDPVMAPSDFLDWLGSWVGMVLDENWPLARRRAAIAHAMELFRLRGTLTGLARHVEIFTGGQVSIADSGGVATNSTPGGTLPGEPVPRLAVRVVVDDPSSVNEAALDRIVAGAKPAHVVHRVEVVAG